MSPVRGNVTRKNILGFTTTQTIASEETERAEPLTG